MTDTWKDDTGAPEQPEQNGDPLQFPDVSFDDTQSPPSEESTHDDPPASSSSPQDQPDAISENDPFSTQESVYSPQRETGPSYGNTEPEDPSPQQSPSNPYGYSGNYTGTYRNPYSSQNRTPYQGYPTGGYYGGGSSYPNNTGGFPPNGQPPVYSPTSGWQEPVAPQPPQKAGRRQKVFLYLVGALAVVLTVSFVAWGGYSAIFGDPDSPPVTNGLPSSSSEDSAPPSSSDEEASASQPEISLGNGGAIEIKDLPAGDALTAKEVYKKVSPSVVGIVSTMTDTEGNETQDEGSGIVATSDGYIITNSHVVNDSRSTIVKVVTKDDIEYPGVVVGYDRTTDLAIVKIEAEGLTPAEFGNADQMEIGDVVLAIGNPGGLDFASSMTQGIISALDRSLGSNSQNGMTYIQTDAAINPGNSGGALVNCYGQVIGINSSKLVAEDFEGMGFAIPVSKAQDILNSLMNIGYVEGRPRLGITGRDITEQEAQFYEVPAGFLIMEIDEESDIDDAGGQVQDIICGVNGQEVSSLSEISDLLLDYSPGDKITLTLYRMSDSTQSDGETFDITITLLEDKGETQNR